MHYRNGNIVNTDKAQFSVSGGFVWEISMRDIQGKDVMHKKKKGLEIK